MDSFIGNGIYKNGYGIVARMVMRDKNLSPEAKCIYAYICSFAGSGDSAFPGMELMQVELKMSENRLYKYRRELIDRGYISIEKQRKGSKWGNNVYRINNNPSEHLQNKGIQKKSKNEHLQNEGIQNEGIENEGLQNEGTNNNSLNNNSLNNNSDNKSSSREDEELKSIMRVSQKVSLHLTKEDADLLKEAYGYEKLVKAIVKTKNVKDIRNPYDLLAKILENMERTTVIENKGKENSLKFNNFEQRVYDYDDLERKLLGWDKED